VSCDDVPAGRCRRFWHYRRTVVRREYPPRALGNAIAAGGALVALILAFDPRCGARLHRSFDRLHEWLRQVSVSGMVMALRATTAVDPSRPSVGLWKCPKSGPLLKVRAGDVTHALPHR
jgi:hypothetical protein